MPLLKTARGIADFQQEAKPYVINMLSGSQKLHKKNCKGCPYSKYVAKYYDFDSAEEAKNSGVEYTRCGNCFKEENK